MNGEGANPRYCKAWQEATMQAKSKLPNSYNVLRHQISTGFSKQWEDRGKLEKAKAIILGKLIYNVSILKTFFLNIKTEALSNWLARQTEMRFYAFNEFYLINRIRWVKIWSF